LIKESLKYIIAISLVVWFSCGWTDAGARRERATKIEDTTNTVNEVKILISSVNKCFQFLEIVPPILVVRLNPFDPFE
jgi:hypothetical protein